MDATAGRPKLPRSPVEAGRSVEIGSGASAQLASVGAAALAIVCIMQCCLGGRLATGQAFSFRLAGYRGDCGVRNVMRGAVSRERMQNAEQWPRTYIIQKQQTELPRHSGACNCNSPDRARVRVHCKQAQMPAKQAANAGAWGWASLNAIDRPSNSQQLEEPTVSEQ